MIPDRIKILREHKGWTQSELAKRLGVTRSSINSYEQGTALPSSKHIIELAYLFHVSSDFLLGIDHTATLDIAGLSEHDIVTLTQLVQRLRRLNLLEDKD